jgi:S-formylglutathione hydrolase FrmB
MKKIQVLSLLFVLFYVQVHAASVDTLVTYSASMKKSIKAVVILPENYKNSGTYPVTYILHGAGGNYADWIKKVPELKDYADQYQMIIVCPDGNVTSWYLDSPVDPSWKYETYVSRELVATIDSKYKTIKDRKGRAITGLSMGGHGALYLAFKHQDVFSAAGSMSGGVDLCPFPENWEIAKRLGTYAKNPDLWKQNSVINLIYLLTPKSLSITFDCGKDDFFYQANLRLHDQLLYNNIPHDFTVRPGGHTWEYWSNSINYHLLFFSKLFKQNLKAG